MKEETYCGKIQISGKCYQVILGQKRKDFDPAIILNERNFDKRWYEALAERMDVSLDYHNPHNLLLLHLFILFSLRRRIYLEELFHLEENLNLTLKNPSRLSMQDYLFECLAAFMRENEFDFRIFHHNGFLYHWDSNVPLTMRDVIRDPEFDRINLFLMARKSARWFYRNFGHIHSRFIRWLSNIYAVIYFSVNKYKYKNLGVLGESSCTYYRCTTASDDDMAFVKCSVGSFSVSNEFRCYSALLDRTSHPELYWPVFLTKSNRHMLFSKYTSASTLKERIRANPLSEEECQALIMFLSEVVTDLRICGIHHRDIKPDNIFVLSDKKDNIIFKISDFGCALIEGESLIRQSMGSRTYAGSDYRWSVSKCDDAASGCAVIRQCCRYINKKDFLQIQQKIGKYSCY